MGLPQAVMAAVMAAVISAAAAAVGIAVEEGMENAVESKWTRSSGLAAQLPPTASSPPALRPSLAVSINFAVNSSFSSTAVGIGTAHIRDVADCSCASKQSSSMSVPQ